MFATASPATAFAGAYQQIGVVTGVAAASPHRLVAMLFEGFDEALAQALGALDAGNVALKCRAIGRAARIVEEGLKASLDHQGGGSLASDLSDLYAYIGVRLVHANLHNDAEALHECRRLMRPLRDAWEAIAPHTAMPA